MVEYCATVWYSHVILPHVWSTPRVNHSWTDCWTAALPTSPEEHMTTWYQVYPLVNKQKLWKMAICSGFSHWKLWFSIAMLDYQRVFWAFLGLAEPATHSVQSPFGGRFDSLQLSFLAPEVVGKPHGHRGLGKWGFSIEVCTRHVFAKWILDHDRPGDVCKYWWNFDKKNMWLGL